MTNTQFEDMWEIMRENKFEMSDNILKGLICTICKKVMVKACSSHCECRYCVECITKYLDAGNQFCPGQLLDCREEMINIDEDIHIDNAINCRISKLVVKCPQESCEYKEELRTIGKHLRASHALPMNCPYHNIGCRETKSPGEKMKNHLVMDNYAHTKYLVEWIDNVTNEMGSLRKFVGGLQGEINNLEDKDRQNQIANKAMKNEINNLKEKEEMTALKNESRLLKEEINNVKEKDRQNQMKVVELKANFNELSQKIDQNYEKHEQLIETLGKMYQRNVDLAERTDQTDLFIKTIESKTETFDRKLIEMELKLSKQNHGEFVWVIENISDKIKLAKDEKTACIFSDAFYSHKNGYKMCLQLYPDGNGSDKGLHLSVYFCLMMGPFDDILSWPFMNNVTFSLINQQFALEHVTKTIKYIDHPSCNKYFNRPTNERNVGFGNCQFIELAQLLSNDALIKNDKLIIKCNVTIA